MIKNLWSILCRQSIIDRESNNVSLIETLEELKINIDIQKVSDPKIEKINIPIAYEFVSLWKRENTNLPEKYNLTLKIIDPSKNILNTFNQEMVLQSGIKRYRSIFKISGISVTTNGEYTFEIEAKKEKEIISSNIPLEINLVKTIKELEKQ